MANDRIYLKCMKCREAMMIYKYYPMGKGYLYPSANELDAFMTRHLDQCQSRGMFLQGNPGFKLETESDVRSTSD